MINKLMLPAVLWSLVLLALAACWTAGAAAMGAPTENYTITDLPNSSSGYPAINPSVNFILEGPTSQTDNQTPAFMAALESPEGNDTVKGSDTWYLDIDINNAGWLYIYEYYPPDNKQGQWIAYKWQLPQSGQWSLGPFSPVDNEPEGMHIYRIWFYHNGQWAAEDTNSSMNNLVYWTYIKAPAAAQAPVQPAVTTKEVGATDQLYGFITNPLVLLFGPSVIVIVVLSFLIYNRRRAQPAKEPDLTESHAEETPPVSHEGKIAVALEPQAPAARAKLSLPNGMDIHLTGGSQTLGRGDLARALGLDDLALISRKHFDIVVDGENFSLEDPGSNNGTLLNGVDIKGNGAVALQDGDIIEPAGKIKLVFHVL